MLSQAPSPGVPEIPAPTGWGISREVAAPFSVGQLRHAQTSQGPVLAGAPSSIYSAFYSDEFELAQSGRTLVWGVDAKGGAPRGFCQRGRTTRGHWAIPGSVERGAQTVCLDGDSRKDNGQSGAGAAKIGRDQTGVVSEKKAQKAPIICLAIYDTLH